MFRFLRLFLFHLKVYVRNQYFLWLPIISTITIFLLQYLTANGYNNLDDPYLWIRSAIFGLWTSATTATGSIGFQRHLGTLKYLINTGINDFISLTALILPASTLIFLPVDDLLSSVITKDIPSIMSPSRIVVLPNSEIALFTISKDSFNALANKGLSGLYNNLEYSFSG